MRWIRDMRFPARQWGFLSGLFLALAIFVAGCTAILGLAMTGMGR